MNEVLMNLVVHIDVFNIQQNKEINRADILSLPNKFKFKCYIHHQIFFLLILAMSVLIESITFFSLYLLFLWFHVVICLWNEKLKKKKTPSQKQGRKIKQKSDWFPPYWYFSHIGNIHNSQCFCWSNSKPRHEFNHSPISIQSLFIIIVLILLTLRWQIKSVIGF